MERGRNEDFYDGRPIAFTMRAACISMISLRERAEERNPRIESSDTCASVAIRVRREEERKRGKGGS